MGLRAPQRVEHSSFAFIGFAARYTDSLLQSYHPTHSSPGFYIPGTYLHCCNRLRSPAGGVKSFSKAEFSRRGGVKQFSQPSFSTYVMRTTERVGLSKSRTCEGLDEILPRGAHHRSANTAQHRAPILRRKSAIKNVSIHPEGQGNSARLRFRQPTTARTPVFRGHPCSGHCYDNHFKCTKKRDGGGGEGVVFSVTFAAGAVSPQRQCTRSLFSDVYGNTEASKILEVPGNPFRRKIAPRAPSRHSRTTPTCHGRRCPRPPRSAMSEEQKTCCWKERPALSFHTHPSR